MKISYLGKTWSPDGGTLAIHLQEGTVASTVVRESESKYTCLRPSCVYQKRNFDCEHAMAAREAYENQIAPTEARKLEQEREKLEYEIARNKAALERMQDRMNQLEPHTEDDAEFILLERRRRILLGG